MSDIDLGKYKITQLGYVYKDIKKQVDLLESTLGIPKFAYLENKGVNYKYRGKDTKIWNKLALSKGIGLQIELIQMIKGECIYSEFIDAGKEGIHHYAIFVDELKPIKENFLRKGFEIVHEGTTGSVNTVHFDTTHSLGVYLEFQEPRKRKR
ncbi:MAG: VOC family protein [Candidatus Heimdallarchaeota archaeon]